jgi:hypothetical protein
VHGGVKIRANFVMILPRMANWKTGEDGSLEDHSGHDPNRGQWLVGELLEHCRHRTACGDARA